MSWLSWGTPLIFYLLIGYLVYHFRAKFQFQGKIIAMLRTKIGINTMHKWGEGAPWLVKTLGYIGIVVGYLGMGFVLYSVFQGLYTLIFVPSAPAAFQPVLPGVKIPGATLFVPFWYGIIALFTTIVVHEFAHGLVAAAHKLKVKASGFVMFGPIPGAFVEPDEKELTKAPKKVQLSVYAAGPFSNVLLALLALFLLSIVPVVDIPSGMMVSGVEPGSGADLAGMPNGTLITSINGVEITENVTFFADSLYNTTPDQTITLGNENNTWEVLTGTHPDNASKGYLGLSQLSFTQSPDPVFVAENGEFAYTGYKVASNLLFWIFLLSLGIGLANLLPLGPVDGGRMFLIFLERFTNKKKAQFIWAKIAVILIFLLIVLVIVPIIKAIIPF